MQAVLDYLNGGGSQREICKKYGILDHHTLRDWILWYNGHKELKERSTVGHSVGSGQIYYVLERHGWRKIMPRSKHPKKANEGAIEASKKLNIL